MVDMDEFLYFVEDNSLKDYLSNKIMIKETSLNSIRHNQWIII